MIGQLAPKTFLRTGFSAVMNKFSTRKHKYKQHLKI